MTQSQSDQFNGHPEDLLLLYVEEVLDPAMNQRVEDHVKTCAQCADNVRRLSEMTLVLRSHAEAFCPEPWELVQMATHCTETMGNLKQHVEGCARCREELKRLSASEETKTIPEWFTQAVKREFPEYRGESRARISRGLFKEIMSKLAGLAPKPAMALGAAAACVLAVVILSRYPHDDIPVSALSTVDWDQPAASLQHKSGMRLMGPGKTKVRTAIVIRFSSKKDAPKQSAVDQMYAQFNPRNTGKAHFDLLSPHEIAAAVGEEGFTTRSARDLSALLNAKLGVSLVAMATVQKMSDGFTINTELMDAATHAVVYADLSGPVPEADVAHHVKDSIIRGLKAYEAAS